MTLLDLSSARPPMSDLDLSSLQHALSRGQLADAAAGLRSLLDAGHASPEVLALLGALAERVGRPDLMGGLHVAPTPAPDAAPPFVAAPARDVTPTASDVPDYYGPVRLTASTLAAAARAPETWESLLAFHGALATDPYVRYVDTYYREQRARFGAAWVYFDIINVLYAAARLRGPARYLEIGVRRGRSLCTVVRGAPDVDVVAFDLWRPNYAGMDNPGPAFVRAEAERAGHRGRLEFVDGDSRRTVPAWFAQHPGVTMDLITVDGDHSEAGARADLRNVLPHLAVGGILVFDDIAHPQHPYLAQVWQEEVASRPDMQCFAWGEAGYGVAFGIRVA